MNVNLAQQITNCVRPHAGLERIVSAQLVHQLLVAIFRKEFANLKSRVPRLHYDVRLAVQNLL